MRLLLLFCWAWAYFNEVKSDGTVNAILGSDAVLKLSNVPQTITTITWKCGTNLAVQWDGRDITYYRCLRGQGKLNISTGELVIQNVTISDSNDYTPEINTILHSKIVLNVYRPVPKPEITMACAVEEEEKVCYLTCAGDTEEAGPITYNWRSSTDDSVSSQEIRVTKTLDNLKLFTCTMENPVSEMTSEPIQPFPPLPRWAPVVIFPGVLILLVLLLALAHRVLAGEWFYTRDAKCWTADFWKKNPPEPAADKQDDKEASVPMTNQ